MTNHTMQVVDNILNDPNQNTAVDDYFSEAALALGASNVPSSP